MRLLLSFAALFSSMALLQLSSGAIGPFDAITGTALGFSRTEVGLMGSAHFLGFFLGCWSAPRLIGAVGHVRTFAAFAALGTIGALAHPLILDAGVWTGLRILTGACIAGCYTVVEAWLQAKLTNQTRGRAMGLYRIVDLGAALVAQLMIGFLPAELYVAYNILAILCCASLMPIMLTQSTPPPTKGAPRLRPLKAIALSPLAAMGVVVAGVTTPAFRMVGPLFGQDMGLSTQQIGVFLALAWGGGAVAQYPTGWLADRYDRRWVLIGVSAIAILVCAASTALPPGAPALLFAMAFVFGAVTFPVFSISAAHANDFAEPDFVVELSASLIFLFGMGAITAPLFASALMDRFGPAALFAMIACAHGVLVLFGLYRMTRRPTQARTAYTYTPRTSFLLGRVLGRKPKD
ncbi:MAG: MFS transporter [Pseudomonadota bacterium]